jgi:hypothetical protein
LVALAVLWLNDHVWKMDHPGLLTGKLSDFAGLFMLPIVVDGVLRRVGLESRRATLLVTALGALWFALANLWAPAQLAYAWTFGALRSLVTASAVHPVVLTPDATDLLALPMVGIGLWLVRATRRPTSREAAPGRRRPGSAARRPRRPSCPAA